jgi:hypothetical protein
MQFLATIKKYSIQNAILKAVLNFYKSNNPCYKHVEITTPPYAQQGSIINQLSTSDLPNSFAEATNSLEVSGT